MESRFNLSAAALRNRELTLFFLLAIAIAGVGAFFKLGQREDPDFAFRSHAGSRTGDCRTSSAGIRAS
jgi:hypothetical protein